MWYPTIVTKNQGFLTSDDVLAPPYLTAPPQTPGLDPALLESDSARNNIHPNNKQKPEITNKNTG